MSLGGRCAWPTGCLQGGSLKVKRLQGRRRCSELHELPCSFVSVFKKEFSSYYNVDLQYLLSNNEKLAAYNEVGVPFGFRAANVSDPSRMRMFVSPHPTMYIAHTKSWGISNQHDYFKSLLSIVRNCRFLTVKTFCRTTYFRLWMVWRVLSKFINVWFINKRNGNPVIVISLKTLQVIFPSYTLSHNDT